MEENSANSPLDMVEVESLRIAPDGISIARYEVIVEEPLLITLAGKPLVTLMCTPGDEIALAIGYLYTEGIICSFSDIGAIGFCREEEGNVVRVIPSGGADFGCRLEAYRTVFSSCSICGREAIQTVTTGIKPFARPEGRLTRQAISDLGDYMNRGQRFFKRTGGTHAAVLGQIEAGRLVTETAILREDIGRHNALDKAVGEALKRKVPLEESILFLSGRLSFEMVAKSARSGISDIAAVSAPTLLAVELARRLNMFLAGFARGEVAFVYSGKEALS